MIAISIVSVLTALAVAVGLAHWFTSNWEPIDRIRAVKVAGLIVLIMIPIAFTIHGWLMWQFHKMAERVVWLADHDDLTGLYNRRAFLSKAESIVARPGAVMRVMLVMLDVDRFKAVNDSHGHAAGDTAIVHVARLLERFAPEEAIIARVGGEEFILFTPWSGNGDILSAMEQLRQTLAVTPVMGAGVSPFTVTISIGVAHGIAAEPLSDIMKRADKALYQAKDAGRNRMQIAA